MRVIGGKLRGKLIHNPTDKTKLEKTMCKCCDCCDCGCDCN